VREQKQQYERKVNQLKANATETEQKMQNEMSEILQSCQVNLMHRVIIPEEDNSTSHCHPYPYPYLYCDIQGAAAEPSG